MIAPYADNVILELEPLEATTKSGIHIVDTSRKHKGHRTARVLASGPGYMSIPTYRSASHLIPNETRAGDRVVVDALAGQDYSLDFNAPRHNKSPEFQELFGRGGEFRIVREAEILAVIEAEETAG